ncbi:MAG: hypothetical protein II867_00885, partial [Clostridia bacterium]|nr:hypothetical protein [Clostridia bacterium]
PVVNNKDEAVGAYLDKRYYLACNIDVDDAFVVSGGTNNSVVIYDIFEKSICMISGVDINSLRDVKTHSGSMLVCSFATSNKNRLGMISESGKMLTTNLKKVYISPVSDMGIQSAKTVREIVVKTAYAVTLRVVLDGTTYEYSVSAKDSPQRIIVEKCGERIGFSLETTGQHLSIAPIVAVIDVMRR